MGSSCPVCGGTPLTSTVRREQLPAMQNYVYRTLDRALSAARGKLEITVCNQCGYAINAAFDSSLLVYDQRVRQQRTFSRDGSVLSSHRSLLMRSTP